MNTVASMKKWLLLACLLIMLGIFFYFRLYHYLSFDILKKYQTVALLWTTEHYKTAVAFYLLIYTLMIACGIPCATVLTLLGGFLFGVIAIIYAVVSTTLGGTILFLAIRTAIGARIAAKSTGWIKKMEDGFQRNAFNYLLTLRLVPIFPCWISNIAAGALNVPLRTFISATILGIFPATLIYVMAGRSLDKVLNANEAHFANLISNPSIFFPLLGLAFLSIFPVIYKKLKK